VTVGGQGQPSPASQGLLQDLDMYGAFGAAAFGNRRAH